MLHPSAISRFLGPLPALLLLAGLPACTQDLYTLTLRPELGVDASQDAATDLTSDGVAKDRGTDSDGCVPDPKGEVCDKKDNDCNGKVDDVSAAILQTDAKNCGKCDNLCSLPNAFPKCVAGKCELDTCAPGYHDVNKDSSDGCEYLCVPSNNGVEACDGLDNDCDKQVDEDFNLTSSVQNCGACGNLCSFNNAGASCAASKCVMGTCTAGYADLDGQSATGCEYKCPVYPATTPDDCDGVDSDCDGKTDEDFTAAACGNTTGQCTAGLESCIGGKKVCQGGTGPTTEKCNNLDDDCDGKTDEDFDKLSDPRYCGGCTACNLPNAFATCALGVCQVAACKTGYFNLDGLHTNGCEYACTVTGAEICDGTDNDCNGKIDTADSGMLQPGSGYCASTGACTGAQVACKGADGWVCSYSSEVEQLPCTKDSDCGATVKCQGGVCPGLLATEETLCDGKDNDCDGQTDEIFTQKGQACLEQGKVGVCQGKGAYACNSVKTGLDCQITSPGKTAADELCNGLDDDCDGTVDEEANDALHKGVIDDMVHIVRSYGGKSFAFYIYRYEASRPDATGTSAGASSTRTCSKAGVLPWSSLSYTQAQSACAASGKRLCTDEEWFLACSGAPATGASGRAFPYSNTYSSSACNGKDYSSSQDQLGPTGSFTGCSSYDGVMDLSGNLKEWTHAPANGSSDPEPVRGGSYDTIEGGLRCDFTFILMPKSYYFPNLGFRCCSDTAP